MQVRPATHGDAEALADIYNHYIGATHVTFDVDPVDADDRRRWLGAHATGRHRALVAVEDVRVVGFASSGPWRPRAAYATSIETSVYCAPDAVGRGIGRALYEALFGALDGEEVHRAYAGIAMPNEASVALHERFGFKQVAYFSEQGRKLGRYWDVAWFEKRLD
ncbi:MAG: N-acetyltransferase family protein [Actinomycetota bacterium]